MTVPAWYWPPSGMAARASALVPYGAGTMVADWTTPSLWYFANGAFSAPTVLASGTPGLAGAAADGANGLWTVGFGGPLWHKASNGTVTSGALPSGKVYIGCTSGAQSYAMASDGTVWSSGAAEIGSFPSSGRLMTSSGSTLAALLPLSGAIGLMTLPGGVTGSIALPASTTGTCLAVASGSPLALGGWQQSTPFSGALAGDAVVDPQNAELMLAVGSGVAYLWTSPAQYSDAWSPSGVLTGLDALSAVAWTPDGTQALTCSPASNNVQVLGYSAASLTLNQTLSVPGACAVAVAADSTHALVAQSGQAQLATLTFNGGSWAAGTPISGVPGIVAVAPVGASGMVAAYASGLLGLSLVAGSWVDSYNVSLGFTPTALTVDMFNQVYVAGSGQLAVVSGGVMTGSGSWTGGAPSALAIQQGRLIASVPADGLLRIFGLSAPGQWTQQNSVAGISGLNGLALSSTTLFILSNTNTYTYGFSGAPFTLSQVQSGTVSLWNGSAWTEVQLGAGHVPSAMAWDTSGNLQVATKQNTRWVVSSAGSVLSSGIIPQYAGQAQTAWLAPSALLETGGTVYCGTSLPGVLIGVA
jgi:hypothetical protein